MGLLFINPGKVPVSYAIDDLRITFDGRTVDNILLKNQGGMIYPGDKSIFWYGTIPNVDILNLPKKGIAEYKAQYTSSARPQRYKSSRKIEYTLNSLEPYSLDWIYLEQSDE